MLMRAYVYMYIFGCFFRSRGGRGKTKIAKKNIVQNYYVKLHHGNVRETKLNPSEMKEW